MIIDRNLGTFSAWMEELSARKVTKQEIVADSTTEAEYIAASDTAKKDNLDQEVRNWTWSDR